MTRIVIVFILFTGFIALFETPGLNALNQPQATSTSSPTADQILDRYIQAIGGKVKLEKLTSRVIKGSIEWSQLSDRTGVVEHYFKAPAKYMAITTATGLGTTKEGFNGSGGWSVNADGSQRSWEGHEVNAAKLYRDFYREVRLRANYPTITLAGKEKIGSKETYVLELTPSAGKPERMYFDVSTGLLLIHEYEVQGPKFTQPFEYYYEDYREVEGVKVPFTIRRMKPSAYIIKLSEVKHNLEVADDKFNQPAKP
jgi:outer membrane lipoprotein-sorting protein